MVDKPNIRSMITNTLICAAYYARIMLSDVYLTNKTTIYGHLNVYMAANKLL